MAEHGVAKTCTKCGQDVRGRERTKDSKGRYWCRACFRRAVAEKRRREAAQDDTHPPAPRTFACPRCAADIAEGSVICTNCGLNLKTGMTRGTTTGHTTKSLVTEIAVAGAVGTSIVLGSVAGAVIGGAVGTALWVGVAIGAGWELSWVAIILGAITGAGAYVGSARRGGVLCGTFAAGVAVIAILGAKFAFVSLSIDDLLERTVDDELAIELIASDIQAEAGNSTFGAYFRRRGFLVSMPSKSWDECLVEARAIWTNDLTDEDRAEGLRLIREDLEMASVNTWALKKDGMIEMLGLMDILFFVVAIMAAFGAGSGGSMSDE